MGKFRKSAVSILIVALLLAISTFVASATEVTFSKAYVDSNQYRSVTSAKKETTTTCADVKITDIYKADGSSSNYKKVYAKATYTGESVLVTKGSYYELTIPASYRSAGNTVYLYAMGHNPSLDCKISGYWLVH